MSDTAELWKAVPGFESLYMVSSLGRVFSHRSSKILKPGKMSGGHLSVCLGRGKTRPVHELMLTAFAGPRPSLNHVARHLNGIHTDNRWPQNLEWATYTRNAQDKKWHGKEIKLCAKRSAEVKKCIAEGMPGVEIARKFGISPQLVSSIKNGRLHCDV